MVRNGLFRRNRTVLSAPTTRRAYRADLNSFAAWLVKQKVEVEDVDARVLAEWVGELGSGRNRLSAATTCT